ncbi:abortive infection family protein [Aerococcus urinaeequi]|uniref:abortive infection family protein n=1 Tax=Aerococcus urinaeequi TaxID=51665 RepID=UPI003D6B0C0A
MISRRLKEKIKINYNEDGYILDFGNDRFNDFTENSIGERIQENLNEKAGVYAYSKGKAFNYFIDHSNDNKIYKLVCDLHNYLSVLVDDKDVGKDYKDLLIKSKEIVTELEQEYTDFNLYSTSEKLKIYFDDNLISKQINLMLDEVYTSPNNAIGKAKNLVETCFKFILSEFEVEYTNSDDFMTLRKKATKALNLDAKENATAKADKNIKKMLSSFTQIISGLNELRNNFGDGHGIDDSFDILPSRYAKLAVNSAITIVDFYLETFEYVKEKNDFV